MPALRHHHLEPVDDVGGPVARLMRVVHREERVDPSSGAIRSVRSGFPTASGPLPAADRRLDHLGVPPRGLLLGDPAGAVALDAEERSIAAGRNPSASCSSMNGTIAISSSRSRSSGEGCAMPIASRTTIRSSSGIAGPVARLPERLVGEGREPLVGGRVEEVEREGPALDGRRPPPRAGSPRPRATGHPHAAHVAWREAVRLIGSRGCRGRPAGRGRPARPRHAGRRRRADTRSRSLT